MSKKSTVPPANFVDTLNANVDNNKLSDAEFREFVRNTLPIVGEEYDLRDIARYATDVFAHHMEGQDVILTSLGMDIAYASLKAAFGKTLNDKQQELVDRYVVDGKIRI